MEPTRISAKVVLLGPQAVGKTSLITALTKGTFSDRVVTTTAPSAVSVTYTVSNVEVQLNIWDTAGQERFRSMAPMYYHGADVVVVVYDITDWDSLAIAKTWLNDARMNIDKLAQICIVGNKIDMADDREIPTSTGQEFAQSVRALFTETTAKDSKGINQLMMEAAECIAECLCSGNSLVYSHFDMDSFQLTDYADSSSLNGSRAASVERDYERKTERKKLSCCHH